MGLTDLQTYFSIAMGLEKNLRNNFEISIVSNVSNRAPNSIIFEEKAILSDLPSLKRSKFRNIAHVFFSFPVLLAKIFLKSLEMIGEKIFSNT